MTEIKDFGNKFVEDRAPIVFKIHGEEFTCVPAVQGKVLLTLVADSASEDATRQANSISNFFEYVLVDESNERFQKLLVSKDKIVPVETLAEVVGWITGQLTDRPNQQPEA
jgi:hypothetical protein